MKIAAEENLDNDIVIRLRKDGHDVKYVSELPPGILDEKVLVIAAEKDWILMTVLVMADTDFEKLLMRQSHVRRGIILYRRRPLFIAERAELFHRSLPSMAMSYFKHSV